MLQGFLKTLVARVVEICPISQIFFGSFGKGKGQINMDEKLILDSKG